jgi:hypothetical protein
MQMTDLAGGPVSPGCTVRRGKEPSNGRLAFVQDRCDKKRWSNEELLFNTKEFSVIELKE